MGSLFLYCVSETEYRRRRRQYDDYRVSETGL